MKKVLSILLVFWGVKAFAAFDVDIEKEWFPQVVQVIVSSEGEKGQVKEKKGSGVIVFSSRGILTSAYLVEGAKSLKIKYGDKFFKGKLIFQDMMTKLSIIEAEGLDRGMMTTGNTKNFSVGEDVGIVGYGYHDKCIFSHGYIAAKRSIEEFNDEKLGSGLMTGEAFIIEARYPNCLVGAGVFNKKGELLGICSHTVTSKEHSGEFGVAIPCELIKKTTGHYAM